MLVINRRVRIDGSLKERRFMIGKDIIVTIKEIDCNKVIIGVQAPSNVRIVREELLALDEVDAIERASGLKK